MDTGLFFKDKSIPPQRTAKAVEPFCFMGPEPLVSSGWKVSVCRPLLRMKSDYEDAYCIISRWSKQETIYKIVDQFLCHYIYFQLPMEVTFTSVVIGPYLTDDLTRERIRETGRTRGSHIADLRMRAVLQLLKETGLQVQTVAQLCGFSDPNYFGKQFKQFYGVIPMQLRKSQGMRVNNLP